MEAVKLTYKLSEGCTASYHCDIGENNLIPARLSIGNLAPSKARNVLGQIKGSYKKQELGKFKDFNKGFIHTSIFSCPQYKNIFGYGILDERLRIYDLLILTKEIDSYTIHYFEGGARPELLHSNLKFINDIK